MSAAGPSGASKAEPSYRLPWSMTREQLANSPSLPFLTEKHGSAEKAREEEVRRRRDTCGFLCETGQKLRMPQLTIATAIVFYHRFFAHKSYEAYDEYNVATTCLFLGSKVEETPKKLKDVIIESAKIKEPAKPPPDADSRDFHVEKERILICERVLLQTLAFDLSVEHAYRPLLAYVKSIKGTRDLAQVAWNFINDSLRTTICLQYAPRCVSAACVFLAAKYLSEKQKKAYALPPYNGGKWYEAFQVTEEVLKDVSDQIMELYPKQDESATSNGTDSATLSGADAGALISRASPAAAAASSNGSGGAAPAPAKEEPSGPSDSADPPAGAAPASGAPPKREGGAADAANGEGDARAKDEPTAKRPRES